MGKFQKNLKVKRTLSLVPSLQFKTKYLGIAKKIEQNKLLTFPENFMFTRFCKLGSIYFLMDGSTSP